MFKKDGKKFIVRERNNARDVALFVLLKICEENRKSNAILQETFDEAEKFGWGLSSVDRAFIERIVIGTLSRLITVDYIISPHLKKPMRFQKGVVKAILRMSVYQILYMDRVPDSAACNEGVKLAKLHGLDGLSGFINGVLRSVVRDKEDKPRLLDDISEPDKRYSLPRWMYSLIKEDYGDQCDRICGSLLHDRARCVRFNLSRANTDDPEAFIRDSLSNEGFESIRVDVEKILNDNHAAFSDGRLPVVYEIRSGGDITKSLTFKKGLINLQDPSSALVASYASPSEGSRVIDVCAAPGGKTIAVADYMGDGGIIESRDISPAKVALIEENVKRCGFKNIKIRKLDALTDDEDSLYRADVLIADLPCSGLGVMAKKPDIKLNLEQYSMDELQALQRDMLGVVSRYVKPRGRLIYSTCTITKRENDDNAAWIAEVLGFRLLKSVQLLPGEHNDGFYIAVFEKKY